MAYYYANEVKPREYICRACESVISIPVGTRGGTRKLCGPCRELGDSVAVVRLRLQGAEQHRCPCGKVFTRPRTKGQRPRWCPDCAAGRGWRRANPSIVAGHRRKAEHRRRAREAAPEAENFGPVEIYERDRWRCGVCRKRVRKDLKYPHPMSPSIDHIVPVVEGGPHIRSNVRLAHLRCNLSRGARGGGEQLLLIG